MKYFPSGPEETDLSQTAYDRLERHTVEQNMRRAASELGWHLVLIRQHPSDPEADEIAIQFVHQGQISHEVVYKIAEETFYYGFFLPSADAAGELFALLRSRCPDVEISHHFPRPWCSFCGTQAPEREIIAGPNCQICTACAAICLSMDDSRDRVEQMPQRDERLEPILEQHLKAARELADSHIPRIREQRRGRIAALEDLRAAFLAEREPEA